MADVVRDILDTIYDKALNGVVGSNSVEEFAEEYLNGSDSLESKVDSLIRWQVAKCGVSGFLSGVGGAITLTVTIPADLSACLYVQMRMAAAIAYMGGHNIHSDKVRTFVYAALCGSSVTNLLTDAGVEFSKKLTVNVIRNKISHETLKKINQRVGMRLFTKAGSKGIINLAKSAPFIGGLVGGGFNVVTTKAIGNAAKRIFLNG